MQRTAAHIDRFDFRRTRRFDGLVITFADHKIFSNQGSEGIQGKGKRSELPIFGVAHREDEAVLFDFQVEVKRAIVMAGGGEDIVFDKIIDRSLTFVFDLGASPDDTTLIEKDVCNPLIFRHG